METDVENQLEIETVSFNLLYTVYSFPNIIMPLFGGIFIDLLGVRTGNLVFSFGLIIGQVICALGGYYKYYWMIIVGRAMYGIGAESLYIAQNAIVSLWFQNKELAFALGLNLSIPRIGSGINSLITPRVIEVTNKSLFAPFIVGAGICFLSWLSAFILVYMDKESDKREGKLTKKDNSSKSSLLSSNEVKISNFVNQHTDSANSENKVIGNSSDQNNNNSSSTPSNSEPPLSEPLLAQIKKNKKIEDEKKKDDKQKEEEEGSEKVRWADIKKLRASFWIIVLLCMFSEGLFVPFLDNANKFYQIRFGFSQQTAGNVLLIPYFFSALISALLGYLIDKFGKRRIFILITTLIYIAVHVLFAFLPNCNSECYETVIPLILFGLAFSLYCSSMVASVPLVVDNKIIGTAFGLLVIFQNASLAVFPLIVGGIF